MPQIDRYLIDEIANETDVATGVLTCLTAIAQAIREQPTDVRALVALADAIDTQKHAIVQAVVAKTTLVPEPLHSDETALLRQTLESERYLRKDAEEKLAQSEADGQDEHNLRLDLQEQIEELQNQIREHAAQAKSSTEKSGGKAEPLTGEGKGA